MVVYDDCESCQDLPMACFKRFKRDICSAVDLCKDTELS